jgi:hypothetical protein
MVSNGVRVAFVQPSCAKPNKNITYFFSAPKLYRYNILAYRANLVLNDTETTLINYIRNYTFTAE